MPVTRDLTKLKTVSISEYRKPKTLTEIETQEDGTPIQGPMDDFSAEQFDQAWTEIANRMKAQGKDSIVVCLTKRKPELTSDFKIMLTIDNKTMENQLEREKQDILDFIRQRLNNSAIIIETRMAEEGEEQAFLYTNKDKFKKLAEKNPHLILLQKRLNLDIEF